MAENLDPSILEELNRILAKDLAELNDYDHQFLRARSKYISRADKTRLGSILAEDEDEREEIRLREEQTRKEREEAEAQAQIERDAHLNTVVDENQELDDDDGEESNQTAEGQTPQG